MPEDRSSHSQSADARHYAVDPQQTHTTHVDKLDFDESRQQSRQRQHEHSHPDETSDESRPLLTNVAEQAAQLDRQKKTRQLIKAFSFICAILNCLCAGSITAYSVYAPLFLKHVRYSQYQVNAVSTAAEIALYLPVPLFGWICDRYNPRPLSAASGVEFGLGYGLAAYVYRRDAQRVQENGDQAGQSIGLMVFAFILVGIGTCSMYFAAVTTCAKNFGRGKRKGIALAIPLAAFGLSGLWQSQVGSHFFREEVDGVKGDMDVFRYFIFLAVVLLAVGLLGGIGLVVVDEEGLIEEAVDQLERSGFLDERPLIRRGLSKISDRDNVDPSSNENGEPEQRSYGALSIRRRSSEAGKSFKSIDNGSIKINKTLLLNTETRLFLRDQTMWFLTLGFFLTTGPGETFTNNVGTLLHTLYPPTASSSNRIPSSNSAATHVSIIAASSTIARLVTGTLSDFLAPTSSRSSSSSDDASFDEPEPPRTCTVSRLWFLLTFTLLFSIAQVILATNLVQSHPDIFPLVSTLVGLGYGSIFSLTPIIVSVVWGVENFGTNWGIVAVVPAAGAALWGVVYSAVYQHGIHASFSGVPGLSNGRGQHDGAFIAAVPDDKVCYGAQCYRATFAAMAVSSWLAMALWLWCWWVWRRRGIPV